MFIKEKRYDDKKKRVFVEVYLDNTPASFPVNGGDLDGTGGVRDDYTFESGSIIYIIDTGELYMAKSTGTWKKQ